MTRKAWMPDPTLNAWVKFLGQTLALAAMGLSGLFYIFNGAMGVRKMRGEVTSLVVDVGELRTDLDQLVVSDSLGKIYDREFRTEIRCAVGMLVDGQTPGYNDCPPEREGVQQ